MLLIEHMSWVFCFSSSAYQSSSKPFVVKRASFVHASPLFSVELFVDNLGDWDKSREYVRTSPEFHKNAMGTLVDADKLVAARQAGLSFTELHRRAYAGEFPPSRPMDPRILM